MNYSPAEGAEQRRSLHLQELQGDTLIIPGCLCPQMARDPKRRPGPEPRHRRPDRRHRRDESLRRDLQQVSAAQRLTNRQQHA